MTTQSFVSSGKSAFSIAPPLLNVLTGIEEWREKVHFKEEDDLFLRDLEDKDPPSIEKLPCVARFDEASDARGLQQVGQAGPL